LIENSEDFRVLRRLPSPPRSDDVLDEERFVGVIVDVETTGLDHDIDEVIELGMVKFAFDRHGHVGAEFAVFQAFNEPSIPIPSAIVDLTGISDLDVRGKRISAEALHAYMDGVSLSLGYAHSSASMAISYPSRCREGRGRTCAKLLQHQYRPASPTAKSTLHY